METSAGITTDMVGRHFQLPCNSHATAMHQFLEQVRVDDLFTLTGAYAWRNRCGLGNPDCQ